METTATGERAIEPPTREGGWWIQDPGSRQGALPGTTAEGAPLWDRPTGALKQLFVWLSYCWGATGGCGLIRQKLSGQQCV